MKNITIYYDNNLEYERNNQNLISQIYFRIYFINVN